MNASWTSPVVPRVWPVRSPRIARWATRRSSSYTRGKSRSMAPAWPWRSSSSNSVTGWVSGWAELGGFMWMGSVAFPSCRPDRGDATRALAVPLCPRDVRFRRRAAHHGTARDPRSRSRSPILEAAMRTMIRNATRLMFGLAVAATAACGGGSDATAPSGPPSPPAGGSVPGGYNLTQVRTLGNLGGGGSGLPVTFVDGGGNQLVFQSGTLIMGSDGAFDLTVESTYQGSSVS